MYSSTYTAVIIQFLTFILPKLGVTIGTEELTTTIQTIITLGTSAYLLFKRWQAGKVGLRVSEVNALGVKQ